MPFHTSSDFETIFESTLGGGYDVVISPPTGDDYEATAIREKDVEKIDEFGNMHGKTTVLHFLKSAVSAQLSRGTQVTLDDTTYRIETLTKETTYVRSYEAS